jgi:hypothetical protein
LELAFETRSIRSTCESPRRAERLLGKKAAVSLRNRLADMRAASNPTELLAGSPLEVEPGFMRLLLTDGKALRFCSNHRRARVGADDSVDWSRVTRVRIVEIGDAR